MNHPQVLDDAGRSASKRPRQKQDCVVRAFSLVLGYTYDEAYETLAELGRKSGRGVPTRLWRNWLMKRGLDYRCFQAEKGQARMSLRRFCETHGEGRWIVRVAGHLTAVIDGRVHDTDTVKSDACVYCAWGK